MVVRADPWNYAILHQSVPFVVHRMGRPYFITALIVRAIQVMGKWILPLLRGVSYRRVEWWRFFFAGARDPFAAAAISGE
jgi:hypothetical protein